MRIGWRGALGFALSAGLLWWTFKDIPFAEVRSGLAHANLGLFVLAAAVAVSRSEFATKGHRAGACGRWR